MQFVLDERAHECLTLNVKGSGFFVFERGTVFSELHWTFFLSALHRFVSA